MNELRSKSSLSQSNRELLELMQRINFGRIEGLRIHAGEPVLIPSPRVIRKLKVGGENGPRPESRCDEFWLKQQAIELLEMIASVGESELVAIEIKYGLPFLVEIEHCADPGGCGHA